MGQLGISLPLEICISINVAFPSIQYTQRPNEKKPGQMDISIQLLPIQVLGVIRLIVLSCIIIWTFHYVGED